MKVLLLKNVPKVGKKDEVVTVADGYATNVLFVKKMAIPATEKAIAQMQKKNNNALIHNKIQSELFEKELERIKGEVTISVKANDKGSLFSRVDQRAISKALADISFAVDEKNIFLPHEIKEKGVHAVEVADLEGKRHPLSVHIV